tara:strand:+ start:4340 stop:4744 length:405 start_codon:yes stop_codon:yes gene_type:complete
MRLTIFGLLFLILSQVQAKTAQLPQCTAKMETVSMILCMDDDIKEFEDLKDFVMTRIYSRIEFKYAKKDPARAKNLKAKINKYAKSWESYRTSYCDLESIHVSDEDTRAQLIKDCLISITKSRIEELRLLQINI